jgi:hypothetical protein
MDNFVEPFYAAKTAPKNLPPSQSEKRLRKVLTDQATQIVSNAVKNWRDGLRRAVREITALTFVDEPPDLSAFDQDRRRALLKQGNRRSRVLISSGGTEPVLDRGCARVQHSVFACAFLAALREAKQPIFSSGELHHMELLPRVGGTTRQQPQRKEIADSNHDNGDFIFVREVKVSTAAAPQ